MNKISILAPLKEAEMMNYSNELNNSYKHLPLSNKNIPINSLECTSETKYDIVDNKNTEYINQNINIGLLNEMQITYNKVNSEIHGDKRINIPTAKKIIGFLNRKKYIDGSLSFKNKKTINHSNNENKNECKNTKFHTEEKNYYKDIPLTFFFQKK